jgi:hypothetical protein
VETDIRSLVLPVTIELQNRSPHLALRWILNLPPPSETGTLYVGNLSARGTLEPGANTEVQTGVWVGEPGLVAMGGWQVERETGEHVREAWSPRMAWGGAWGAQSVEVLQA